LLIAANGGPGSDSLIGWLTELGTFQLDERSLEQNTTSVPRLFRNPNAWSTISNMVIFSHPAPVGYSYCDSQEDCYSNDERAGDDLRDGLQAIMDKFTEWKGRELYLTGESYAGIYVPQVRHTDNSTSESIQRSIGGQMPHGSVALNNNNSNHFDCPIMT